MFSILLAYPPRAIVHQRVGEGHQPLDIANDSTAARTLRGSHARPDVPAVFTKCGNQYPSSERVTLRSTGAGGMAARRVISAINVSSYGWVYEW
eukprot:SAG31_NODE_601_length_13643_cov_64.237005_6_plen_94_part_00